MTMPRSARRGRRLSRSAEFERVYRRGKSVSDRHLVLYTFPNEASDGLRLGLSVSRKVGGAVERNRIKRLVREAFARWEGELERGHDVVVVARPQARELAEREGLEGISGALAGLLGRSGLRPGDAPGARVQTETRAQGELQVQGEPHAAGGSDG